MDNFDIHNPLAINAAMQSNDWKARAFIRAAFRRSLYITCKVGTCWGEQPNLMDAETYLKSCDWIQDVVVRIKRGLFEDPRSFIKTTRCTRTVPTWCGIQRPSEEWDFPQEIDRALEFLLARPHLKGPDSRLAIGSDSKDNASKWTGSVRSEWDGNPLLRWAFPELIWTPGIQLPAWATWTKSEFMLNGRIQTSYADGFLRAIGIASKAQGGRCDGLIIDDLVGETSYKSVTELQRRRDWIDTIGFLMENRDPGSPQGGFIIIVGNRWALDDVNSRVHEEFEHYSIWHRKGFCCMTHGRDNCGRQQSLGTEGKICAPTNIPLWIARYPDAESMDRLKADCGGEQEFAAQILNDPTAAAELDANNFHKFYLAPRTLKADGNKDPYRAWACVLPYVNAEGEEREGADPVEVIPVDALSAHVISIDPASSKEVKNARTAVSWCAFDKPTDRGFWLACDAGHWDASQAPYQAVRTFVSACDKLRMAKPRILIEKVAMQVYFENGMRLAHKRMKERKERTFDLSPIEHIPPEHGINKEDRIRRRVGHRLNQGLLYLCAGVQLPKYEARHFPTGTKDALDTWAQAEEIFLEMVSTSGAQRRDRARKRKRRLRVLAADVTGVSI